MVGSTQLFQPWVTPFEGNHPKFMENCSSRRSEIQNTGMAARNMARVDRE